MLYVVQNELGSLAEHPTHILMVWMGGLSFYGGLIGGLLALVVFARRRGISLLPPSTSRRPRPRSARRSDTSGA